MNAIHLRAFALIYSMLRALLQVGGVRMSGGYIEECDKTFNEIVSEVEE